MGNYQFEFKKKYGQNFLKDQNIVKKIADSADIQSGSLVIEIGPGAGVLTSQLSKIADQVLAYEIDTSLENVLNCNLKENKNIDIIYDDFLKRNLKKDLEKYSYEHLYVVANLPYYITTPIIVKLIEEEVDIDCIVIMVQKEVGDRFGAKPGSKDYNSLTVFLNYYFDIKKLFIVNKNQFIPKPNVDSIVVKISKKEQHYNLKNKELFFKLVRDSFKYKRKTLKNNLKGYDLLTITSVLEKYNLNLSVRAEQLPLEVFVDISNQLNND